MFSCSDRIVVDPNDIEPILVMVTTHQRQLRKYIRTLVDCKIRKTTKRNWYGIPMTYVFVHCPDHADYDKILKIFPYQRISRTPPL